MVGAFFGLLVVSLTQIRGVAAGKAGGGAVGKMTKQENVQVEHLETQGHVWANREEQKLAHEGAGKKVTAGVGQTAKVLEQRDEDELKKLEVGKATPKDLATLARQEHAVEKRVEKKVEKKVERQVSHGHPLAVLHSMSEAKSANNEEKTLAKIEKTIGQLEKLDMKEHAAVKSGDLGVAVSSSSDTFSTVATAVSNNGPKLRPTPSSTGVIGIVMGVLLAIAIALYVHQRRQTLGVQKQFHDATTLSFKASARMPNPATATGTGIEVEEDDFV